MRSHLRYLGATAVLLAVAACSDTAPTAVPVARSISPESRFDYGQTGYSFGLQGADFTLTSRGGSFSINGMFTVNFPANSVCDPANSTYGPTEWDNPCVTLSDDQSIPVHATLSLSGVGVAVDFTPALRFSPSTVVTISTDMFAGPLTYGAAYFSQNPQALSSLAVYYAPSLGAAPVYDFLSDPSLITHVNLQTGIVWRRIKHFSGYTQTAGSSCDAGQNNPDCVKIDAPAGGP